VRRSVQIENWKTWERFKSNLNGVWREVMCRVCPRARALHEVRLAQWRSLRHLMNAQPKNVIADGVESLMKECNSQWKTRIPTRQEGNSALYSLLLLVIKTSQGL
jgi:hypothetical protein